MFETTHFTLWEKILPISCHSFLFVVAVNADIIITCAGVATYMTVYNSMFLYIANFQCMFYIID